MRWPFAIILLVLNNNLFVKTDDCNEYNGTRPFIWPQYGYKSILNVSYRNPALHPYIVTDSNSVAIQLFDCSYNRPIHWVFHLNPLDRKLGVHMDFYERVRFGSEINYTASFDLQYIGTLSRDMLFSCQPRDLANECERNFIQIRNLRLEKKPTAFPDPTLSIESEALFNSSIESVSSFNYDWNECPLRLLLHSKTGNEIWFKWEVFNGAEYVDGCKPGAFGIIPQTCGVVLTNETAYLENVLRFNRTLACYIEKNCVLVLGENEPFPSAKSAQVPVAINYTINAAVFYAAYNGSTMVFKGIYSVPRDDRIERRFYLEWQLTPLVIEEEMIQLVVPSQVYVNMEFNATCRFSKFVFATFRTVITDQPSPENETIQVKEKFTPFGYVEVVRSMEFDSPGVAKDVSCFASLRSSTEWVAKTESVFVEDAIPPSIDNSTKGKSEQRIVLPGEVVIIGCYVSGSPMPSFQWSHSLKGNAAAELEYNYTETKAWITFPKWESRFDGTYKCEAVNYLGSVIKSITLNSVQAQAGGVANIFIIATVSLVGVTLVLGGLIGFLLYRIRKQRLDYARQTQKAVEEFRKGLQIETATEMDTNDPNFNVLLMPYNEAFEVSSGDWEIEDKILGSGQFGIVKMGSVLINNVKRKVAVKTLKSNIEIEEFKSFLFELKIMAYLGQHKNIVSLVAACSESINDRDIWLGVEFCDNGCLLDYLRKYRSAFRNMVTPTGKLAPDVVGQNADCNYENLSTITTYDLYRWAYHIACGMDYLRTRKVLHGDLAARNVLLTSRKSAKVGDFGLSRVLMNSENYMKQSNTPLPWKWMAIESLKAKAFSTQTDVWSYGICLYEIFTLGQSPYPGMSWSPDFITQLENGMRMERPALCTISIYKVMRSCWEASPQLRPEYFLAKRKLSKGLKRLSTIVKTSERQRPTTTNTRVLQIPTVVEPRETVDIENSGVYFNIRKSTMNYYKNQ